MTERIIGIAGTNGSGKDTVGRILAEEFGFLFLTVTIALREEARRRGLPPEREALRTISAEWRREYGLAVLINKALMQYEAVRDNYNGFAVASLRNPAEADRIHELGGIVLWIDANPRLRYDRIQANAATRDRTHEDDKTFEQFVAEEQTEMQSSGDAATLNMSAVKAKADRTIMNEFPTIEGLVEAIRQIVGEFS